MFTTSSTLDNNARATSGVVFTETKWTGSFWGDIVLEIGIKLIELRWMEEKKVHKKM
jgi:hypothetical protein